MISFLLASSMSRIGKKPIEIPEGVELNIDGQTVRVKSSKGELSFSFRREIGVEISGDRILVKELQKTRKSSAFWGTTRAIIAGMVKGVTEGFEKKLAFEGIGYRAEIQGKDLVLYLGFSHPVKIPASQDIQFTVDKNVITVRGIDRQKVGAIAAKIRAVKKPEPYKGTGIKYVGEIIRKKAGKKAVTTAG